MDCYVTILGFPIDNGFDNDQLLLSWINSNVRVNIYDSSNKCVLQKEDNFFVYDM
jgi:hypothetical protein